MKTSATKIENGKFKLKDINPSSSGEYKNKEEGEARLEELRPHLSQLQEALYAEHKQSLLLVFQAMDTGGKDGAVKGLLTGVNPAGVQVNSFKAPSGDELEHDFLWRVHQHTPPKGIIGVWNRSHYEDVLIARVHKLVEEKVWRARYGAINNFEQLLVQSGVTILKFFLLIDKDEQKTRLQSRLDNKDKNWKFNEGDLAERELWDDYMAAYQDAINNCSSENAPWYVVPANKKWARNVAIAEIVTHTLEKMNPQYPQVDFDAKSIHIK